MNLYLSICNVDNGLILMRLGRFQVALIDMAGCRVGREESIVCHPVRIFDKAECLCRMGRLQNALVVEGVRLRP